MENLLTFAIGDVHGCFDKLQALVLACEQVGGGRDARFILIGDYIDRGPHSRDVIDFLIQRQHGEGSRFICLRGNHEQMLIDAVAEGRLRRDLTTHWLSNGGKHTLHSYGVDDPASLPAAHLDWIRALPFTFSDSRRLYVHAGIRPGVPVADQSPDDLLWIRGPFLWSEAAHPGFIVHGHTPTDSGLPDLRAHRLNLDTGACYGGELTAAAFTDRATRPFLFVDSLGATWRP
jgi:serine/threonine protein phosphatase 1